MRRTFAAGSFALFVAVFAACDVKPAAPRPAPLEPPARASTVEAGTAKAELARPVEPEPAAPVASAPPIAPAEFDAVMQAIGPIELQSADEAKKKAESEITPQNAEAELKKLRDELGGGG